MRFPLSCFLFVSFALLAGCGASTPQVLNFRSAELPAIEGMVGVSGGEPWGRWTDGTQATMTLKHALPARFNLVIATNGAYGGSVGKKFEVTIGGQRREFVGPQSAELIELEFDEVPDGTHTFTIRVPDPSSPKSLGLSDDARELGLSLLMIVIDPLGTD